MSSLNADLGNDTTMRAALYGAAALVGVLFYMRFLHVWFVSTFLSGFVAKHRKIGAMLGVKYRRTDEWVTNRDDTSLDVGSSSLIKPLLGFSVQIGDPVFIRDLKAKQRKATRNMDLTRYMKERLGKPMTGRELEKLLIHIWYRELTDIYELPKTDEDKFVSMSLNLRQLISNGRNVFKSLYVLWQMRGELMFARRYMRELGDIGGSLLTAPLLTTVDTTIINLLCSPDPAPSFHAMFETSPVKMTVMRSKEHGLVVLDVIPNEADNPGNSAFGPKGVICPGNLVTSMVLKAVQQCKSEIVLERTKDSAVPVVPSDRFLTCVSNLDDVIVVPRLRSEVENTA